MMGDVSITISFPAEYDTEVFYCDFDSMGGSVIIGLGMLWLVWTSEGSYVGCEVL